MCEICRQNPCCPACPNHVDELVEICCECGAKIFEGDDYYNIEGIVLCENCIDKFKMKGEVSK